MTFCAAIFDLDGVIVLSARLHELSWNKLAENHGYPAPAIPRIGSLGVKTEYVISEMLKWTDDPECIRRLTIEKENIFRDMVREMGIDAVRGVQDFIHRMHRRGVPLAVGSSAPRENIEVSLAALGIREAFRVIVSGGDVSHGKPAPDIFLTAAQRLGISPAQCVVFEDAPAGVAAAKAAGMRVIGVLTAHSEAVLVGADRFIRDFTELVEDMDLLQPLGTVVVC